MWKDAMACRSTSQLSRLRFLSIEIFTDGPTVFCGEQEIELYAIGPDTIVWNNEMMGDMIVIDTAGVYSASGRGENGCVGSSDPLEIEFIELPDVDMAITDDTVCISDAPVPMISIPTMVFMLARALKFQVCSILLLLVVVHIFSLTNGSMKMGARAHPQRSLFMSCFTLQCSLSQLIPCV
jgi:hypothetical protein